MNLQQGKRYEATLMLTGFKQIASNEMVKEELTRAGFAEVTISGTGKQRKAIGRWPLADVNNAPVPKEVTEIKEV